MRIFLRKLICSICCLFVCFSCQLNTKIKMFKWRLVELNRKVSMTNDNLSEYFVIIIFKKEKLIK